MIRALSITSLALYTLFLAGCSGAGDPPPPLSVDESAVTKAPPSPVDPCDNHEQGCSCDTPGEVTDCGRIKRVEGNYVWCATGHQICGDDGAWGACKGDVDLGASSSAQ